MKMNNYNHLSPARWTFKRLPRPLSQGRKLDESISVARVRPRTSKGITAFEYNRLVDATAVVAVCTTSDILHFVLLALHSKTPFTGGLARSSSILSSRRVHPHLTARYDGPTLRSHHEIGRHCMTVSGPPSYQVVSPAISERC